MIEPCTDCKFVCRDCSVVHPRIFMVHDTVWVDEAGLPKTKCLMCIACFERVIGRHLVESDFTAAPCNWWPQFGEPLRREPGTSPEEVAARYTEKLRKYT